MIPGLACSLHRGVIRAAREQAAPATEFAMQMLTAAETTIAEDWFHGIIVHRNCICSQSHLRQALGIIDHGGNRAVLFGCPVCGHQTFFDAKKVGV